MDKIYRKISLEDFKYRFISDSAATGWNEVHDDYAFTEGNLYALHEQLAMHEILGCTVSGNPIYRFRYGNIVALNTWLNKVFDESHFYKYCVRGWTEEKKVYVPSKPEDEEGRELTDYDAIETNFPENAIVGDLIWITPYAEELKARFRNNEITGNTAIIEFLEFFNAAIFDNQRVVKKRRGRKAAGTENCPNHRELIEGYVEINLPLSQEIINIGMMAKGDGELKEIAESGETLYDGSENLKFSMGDEEYTLIGLAESSRTATTTTGFTESRLQTLRRRIRTYDDNGNELPFILSENEFDESGNSLCNYVDLSDNTQIHVIDCFSEYTEGAVYNISVSDDGNTYYGDYIDTISTGETESGDTVTFVYYIGAIVDEYGVSGGTRYEDSYYFDSGATVFGTFENKIHQFRYNKIIYDSIEKPDEYMEGMLYSKTEFESYNVENDSGVPYIKEEALMGIEDIVRSGDGIYIERGTAAAFEIHNVLGECRTMDDLEKYRNDFFTIRNDEKEQ